MNLGGWCDARCKGTVRWQQLKALPGNCPLASPGIAERQQAIKAEPASDTLQALDTLPFRPIGYEW